MLQGKPVLHETEAEWLFCYGTLRDTSFYERLTRAPTLPSVPATLQGWIQFDVPGAAYPGAVPSRFSDIVQGELRRIQTASDWDILDTYEGNEYQRVPCVVETARGPLKVQIYRYDLERHLRIENLADCAEWKRTIGDWSSQECRLTQPNFPSFDCGPTAAHNEDCSDISHGFVSLLNEVPVGSSRLESCVISELGKYTPRISGLYVIRELRHLGLGTMLVEGTVEKARQLGLRELYLSTQDRQQFFEHLGWRTLRTVRIEDRDINLMHRLIWGGKRAG